MTLRRKVTCDGLWRDPSPHGKVPPGGMDVADEAVIRRLGIAEPRPGFTQLNTPRNDDMTELDGMIAHDGDVFVQDAVNDGLRPYMAEPEFFMRHGYGEDGTNAADCPSTAVRGLSYKQTLYFCGSDNTRKIVPGGHSLCEQAGLPPPLLTAVIGDNSASATKNPIQPLNYVAYRAVVRTTDSAGRVVTSYPSARAVVYNLNAVSARAATFHVELPSYLASSTQYDKIEVEVYRSKNSTGATPPDELFLTRAVTLAEIVAASGQFSDAYTLDAELGKALYTNPSRETFTRANSLPPACHDLAHYAGSMFAARLTYPHRLTLRWTELDDGGGASGSATGIGLRGTTADITAGNAQLTAVASTTGVQVGMLCALSGRSATGAPSNPWLVVTAVGAGTVTLSQTFSGGSAAGAVVAFVDAVHVYDGSDTEIFPNRIAWRLAKSFNSDTSASPSDAINPASKDSEMVRVFGVGEIHRSEQYGPVIDLSPSDTDSVRTLVLERFRASDGQFWVAATHGNEYQPAVPLPTVDEADWAASEQPQTQDSVAWSKDEEPEHFMEGAGRQIGVQRVPILRIFGTIDALYVLKARGDGIYRMTGFGERSGWRVEQVSSTASLLHPHLACKLGESVYAWTAEGPVELSSAGLRHIATGASDFKHFERLMNDAVSHPGSFCVANTKEGEVIWGLPELAAAGEGNAWTEVAGSAYCFNARTRSWTRWFAESNRFCAAVESAEDLSDGGGNDFGLGLLVFGPRAATEDVLRVERRAGGEVFAADRTFTGVNGDVADNEDGTSEVEIDPGSGWTPAVGDVIFDSASDYFPVTAVDSATVFTVRGVPEGGAFNAYEGFTFRARWLPEFGAGPAALKRFTSLHAHFEAINGAAAVSVTAQTPLSTSAASQSYDQTYSHDFDPAVSADVRALLPPDAAMGQRISMGVTLRQADARFRLTGMTLDYRDSGVAGTR